MIQLKTPVMLSTDGQGLWSNRAAEVKVTGLEVPYVSDDSEFGELRVYFDTDTWDINQHGLIYTDRLFEKRLYAVLKTMGLNTRDVSYSEQGMQGDDYVSFDIGGDFITSWKKKTAVTK